MKFFYTFHNLKQLTFNNLNSWNKIQDRFTFSSIIIHSDMTLVWILIFFEYHMALLGNFDFFKINNREIINI